MTTTELIQPELFDAVRTPDEPPAPEPTPDEPTPAEPTDDE